MTSASTDLVTDRYDGGRATRDAARLKAKDAAESYAAWREIQRSRHQLVGRVIAAVAITLILGVATWLR
jgi:hypothetical protein